MSQDRSFFFSEIFWIATALIVLLVFGYAIGEPWFFFSLGLLIYIAWHLKQLSRLIAWLSNNALDMPPDASGFWGDIFRHLYRIQRHNRHRQEKLMVLLNRYKDSTEAMPDGTIILGRNWEIEWFNSKCEKYFGLKKNHDIGQPFTNLIRNPALPDFLESNRNSFEANSMLDMSSPDNKRTLSIRLIPYGRKHLIIARDITKIQKLKEIRKDFVANVSHELRTPLTVITGYLEALEDHLKDQPQYTSPIQLMQQQSNRMCSIVEDLLLLSKIESNEKKVLQNEYVNIPALLMMFKKEALVLSGGRHQIDVIVEDVKWLRGDSKELQSAFSNLISNAIRYTPEGGEIIIRWYIDAQQQGCFEVQDSGEGIAEHHLDRITERFYRIDVGRSRATGGTGLGLAIVKHVLNHHEARLVIESQIGAGSLFRCEFPAGMIKKH
ncbi:MAG: phosphate regulon sensor histidine kinase PhoR [Gammaproteobacteria bacterium]|nr:phosphate regulon sensor histidine kinase PhoR [Gammaproteobacteria bacterium]